MPNGNLMSDWRNMKFDCCNNPNPRWMRAGSVFTTYGEYDDDIVEYLECENCLTVLCDETCEESEELEWELERK